MHPPERPREKALHEGVVHLSNSELLAILLRCGYPGCGVLELAEKLISKANGIANLKRMSIDEISAIKGISKVKAIELLCAFELAKRASYEVLKEKPLLNESRKIASYLQDKIGSEKQEHFVVLFLNTKLMLLSERTLFIGSLNASVVSCREIFKAAIEEGCAKILISHNHPSGDCIPSEQDLVVTNQISQTSEMVGIPLLDHIIVSASSYFSFKEHHLF